MKTVVVAPLDWGLGHATRCIPIIEELIARQSQVILASSGRALALLRKEFPALNATELPGYAPVYPEKSSMVWKMATQLPGFLSVVRSEHARTEEIVRKYHVDIVISDNRYGCWSDSAHTILITHQSNVLMPRRFGWLSPWVKKMVRSHIERFDACWIPDFPDARLTGTLTSFGKHDFNVPLVHIGPLSRFAPRTDSEIRYDVAAIFSGPEPQRTILEKIIEPQLRQSGLRFFIARGLPGEAVNNARTKENAADFLTSSELENLLASSSVIISRSGYSTIMDLARMGKKAILIPTPGQTEQEYLASQLKKNGIAFSTDQKHFNLQLALKESHVYSGFENFPAENDLVKLAIGRLLEKP
jgi:uncharacterized protein (TIGR00661 family)